MGKWSRINGPIRMCAACRERFPKRELTRYACALIGEHGSETTGGPVPDPEQVMPGRGIYVCSAEACRKKFSDGKAFRKLCKGV